MITQHRSGDVALVTLDRHERRNALDVAHLRDLDAVLRDVLAGGARAVVLTGSGSSFCSGADLDEVYGATFREALGAVVRTLVEATVPVLAAVNGPAIGAGTQLALACDLRVVAPTARFAVPTARNGLAVDPWTVRRLGLLAGVGTARAVLLGVETLDAHRALACGLADRAGGHADALAWAGEIATLAPLSLHYAKLALNGLFESAATGEAVQAAYEACWTSEDVAEGRRARTERRPPRFTGH